MSPQDKVIDKIEKLLRKAHGTDSKEEAQAFAAKAQELATRNKLSLSEIEWDEEAPNKQEVGSEYWDPRDYGLKHKRARTLWKIRLAEIVARFNECAILSVQGSNRLFVAGAPEDRQVFSHVYVYLYREIESGVNRDYQRHRTQMIDEYGEWGAKRQIKGYRASWRDGFLDAIRTRLKKDRERIVEDYESGTALVRLENQLQKAQSYANRRARRGSAMRGQRGGNASGRSDGHRAGQRANLNPSVGGSSERKALT